MTSTRYDTPARPLYEQAPTGALDLFSTSQKDVLFVFERCVYRAPLFAYEIKGKTYGISQGCCNHWDCPRCGQQRARHEYGRIVEGCRILEAAQPLYFLTLTCKGKHLSLAEAMRNYLLWTNRLFTTLRAEAKTRGALWAYVQVTEQQGRGHPHSHVLTTYAPPDLLVGYKKSWKVTPDGMRMYTNARVLRSQYLAKCVVSSGLGEQYDISKVDKVEGASRYVAKYLFHPDMFKAKYPKGWKRIRYSQSFPKLLPAETTCFVLLTSEDWRVLARAALVVDCHGEIAYYEAEHFLRGADCIIQRRGEKRMVLD